MSLYREQAMQNRSNGFSNPISIRGNLPASVMLAGLLAIVVGFVVFSLNFSYTRRVTVQGYLDSAAGQVGVTTPTSGNLKLQVDNGTLVKAGDLIATVSSGEISAEGVSSITADITALELKLRISREQIELARTRLETLDEQEASALSLHDEKVALAEDRLKIFTRDHDIAQEEATRSEDLLARRLVNAQAVAQAQRTVLSAREQMLAAKNALAIMDSEKRQLELDWRSQKLDLQQALSGMERDAAEIEAEIIRLRSRSRAGVFAPIDGILTYSRAQAEEQVTAGQQLFTIEPAGSDLVGILLAPSSAIGFVGVEDIVRLRYAAFPYREHGVFDGEVFEIDRVAQLPTAIDAPLTVGEPVYRIWVNIDQAPRNKAGRDLRLASGMLFEASVIIDEKPLLFWLLDPVL